MLKFAILFFLAHFTAVCKPISRLCNLVQNDFTGFTATTIVIMLRSAFLFTHIAFTFRLLTLPLSTVIMLIPDAGTDSTHEK